MKDINIKEELINLVSQIFHDKGMDSDLIEFAGLIDDLGMDSIVFISMVLEIEERFGVFIPDEIIIPENFNSIDNIDQILRGIIESKGDEK